MRGDDVVSNEDRNLVNPYGNPSRRRFGFSAGASALRRRLVLLIVLLVSVAMVVGTVGTSCVPQVVQPPDVTSVPPR